jgi:hypothetical protein
MPVIQHKGRARTKKKPGGRKRVKAKVKRRSASAAALASPLYRKRVVKSVKTYSRKVKSRANNEDSDEA